MKVINCVQGSPEWHAARAGACTASNFAEVRKRLKSGANKGEFSQAAKQYAFRLAVERISVQRLEEDKFETYEMRRGRELEPIARLKHEQKKRIFVEQTGIVLADDGKFGASVDGLIGNDGTSEYKCFISPNSLMPILLENDISDCVDQVQGQLWITGRKWCDFVLYCPALELIGKDLTIIRVNRDDEFIAKMEVDLLEFDNLVSAYIDKLLTSGNLMAE
jgi:hypothetical protein